MRITGSVMSEDATRLANKDEKVSLGKFLQALIELVGREKPSPSILVSTLFTTLAQAYVKNGVSKREFQETAAKFYDHVYNQLGSGNCDPYGTQTFAMCGGCLRHIVVLINSKLGHHVNFLATKCSSCKHTNELERMIHQLSDMHKVD